jgi:TolB protein
MRRRTQVLYAFVLFTAALGTNSPAEATYPGTGNGRLAFGMIVDGNRDIYSVMPGGQGLRRLTDDPAFDACPTYSADGHQIAWCSAAGSDPGVFEIWTMKQNGTDKHQVTHLGAAAIFPDFSPDGSRIVFDGNVGGVRNVYLVNIDGTGLTQLTANAGTVNGFPVFSPDGSKIAFISDRTGLEQVWVMNADGSSPTQLTFDAADHDQTPDWSPDGAHIAYEDDATGNGDIYVMDADGTHHTRLTTDADPEFGTAWSPDGSKIAYVRIVNNDLAARTVYVMDADGTDQHAVHPGPGPQVVPAWQPHTEPDNG